jgi:hypothetical protein
MTPDTIFSIVNPLALVSWILLAVLPRQAWIRRWIIGLGVPLVLAATYAALIAACWGGSRGGFSTLTAVAELFANRWLLLAGWVHYLCFDLLIGRWEVEDAQTRGVPHLLVVPCLLLTFLFGPAGWLLYTVLSAAYRGKQAL